MLLQEYYCALIYALRIDKKRGSTVEIDITKPTTTTPIHNNMYSSTINTLLTCYIVLQHDRGLKTGLKSTALLFSKGGFRDPKSLRLAIMLQICLMLILLLVIMLALDTQAYSLQVCIYCSIYHEGKQNPYKAAGLTTTSSWSQQWLTHTRTYTHAYWMLIHLLIPLKERKTGYTTKIQPCNQMFLNITHHQLKS